MVDTLVTHFLGNCQLCEGDFKCHDGKMVHHGFTRPGCGYIVGDCGGVHQDPYEVSCALIPPFKAALEVRLAFTLDRINAFKSGAVKYFAASNWRGTVIEYAVGVTYLVTWEDAVRHEIAKLEGDAGSLPRHIRHLEARIANWRPMPIREIDEAKQDAAKRAEQAARAAIAAAKREAKQAEANALKAKRVAREEQRQAVMKEFGDRFNELAVNPTPQNKILADKWMTEFCKKKYEKFGAIYLSEMNCTAALVTLGLATGSSAEQSQDIHSYRHH